MWFTLLGQQQLLWVFSRRFLEGDINDPTLNQALLDAFFGDFDLCGEFKKLYVYPLITEPQLVSQIPVDKKQSFSSFGYDNITFEEFLREWIPAIAEPPFNIQVAAESDLLFYYQAHNENAVHSSPLYSSDFISKLRGERCICK
jgi:hypothetical protein